MGARLPPRADHEAEASFPHYAAGLKLRFDFFHNHPSLLAKPEFMNVW
jgi:hypothetical protein